MDKKYLKLNDIDAYKIAFNLSNYVWDLVIKWTRFNSDTIGKQFVRSVDSISANIAEGFGRYSKKDKVRFFRISFGSMYESLDWNEKAFKRNLLSKKEYSYIFSELQKLPKLIHQLIKFTNSKLSE
ncbi:MAG: four helix bundle protein [Ignavibacteriaceae bacterium]|nr:four helix bundle protein [Ignavibacteriaceae bacterium]